MVYFVVWILGRAAATHTVIASHMNYPESRKRGLPIADNHIKSDGQAD